MTLMTEFPRVVPETKPDVVTGHPFSGLLSWKLRSLRRVLAREVPESDMLTRSGSPWQHGTTQSYMTSRHTACS